MRVIVGTYRGRTHIPDALRSLDAYLHGMSDLVFVNDSPDPEDSAWLAQYGKVIDVGGQGYTKAMQVVCHAAEGQPIMFWEEDFELLTHTHLEDLNEILWHRPHLAQIALLRGPHFPIEHEHGGLIEALVAQGHSFPEIGGVIEQTATFTCNPSVWRAHVTDLGWPQYGGYTEEVKRDDLLRLGYRFGFLPGIRVSHSGIRQGKGYRA